MDESARLADRERFEGALRATGRGGVENVLNELDRLGFFEAPASTKFHLAEKGGLLRHSLNVYDQARLLRQVECRVRPDLAERLPEDGVAVASLLHDVCKADVYREELKHRKVGGRWEDYVGYAYDSSSFPLGHGEKSVIRLLRWGLEMTDDEMIAIRWHMHAWDLADSPEARGSYGSASDRCPLLAILVAADGLAAHIQEAK